MILFTPKELHELYQKNAQLLSQLSATGRHNNILQSELSDLIQKKSQADITNNSLKEEVCSLTEKMSLFNFKHKKFTEQSLRLKQELNKKSEPASSPKPAPYPEKTFRKIYADLTNKYDQQMRSLQLFEKKEIVYKNQIKNLETRYHKLKNQEKDYKVRIQGLKTSVHSDEKKEEYLELKIKNNYQDEIDTLRNNYENLRKVISQQEEGFKETLQNFRRKQIHIINHKPQISLESDLKEINKLKLKINEIIQQNTSLKKRVSGTRDLDLEFQQKINDIQLTSQKKIQHLNETHEREKQSVKNENEKYKKQLEHSYNERLKHIRAEMENDLCGEKRRVEVLKTIKEKQETELKNQLKELQYQIHNFKSSNETFKNVHGDIEKKLNDEIVKNENLKTQNKQLENLWQSIQQNLEERNQQVHSLQKLNRELSLSLNQKNQSTLSLESVLKKSTPFSKTEPPTLETSKEKKKDESFNEILADLHFD